MVSTKLRRPLLLPKGPLCAVRSPILLIVGIVVSSADVPICHARRGIDVDLAVVSARVRARRVVVVRNTQLADPPPVGEDRFPIRVTIHLAVSC